MVDLFFTGSIFLCAISAMAILLLPLNMCSEEFHVYFLVHRISLLH